MLKLVKEFLDIYVIAIMLLLYNVSCCYINKSKSLAKLLKLKQVHHSFESFTIYMQNCLTKVTIDLSNA